MLDAKIEGVMEIYEKFVGDDPRDTPMRIFPGMHYSMGGLYVRFEADPQTQTPLAGSPDEPGHQHPRPVRRAARRTTPTTARTAWAPTRCSPASTRA